ncbi:PH domain-containing protein [Micromonospora parathelypteridis]|uniref:Putative membrane protein n=1 Tax=Micromonospora parathelypteridis TaxID=1839617 RepID=A0A840VHZ2_9ACTN|nr:PH domain-containing protein [Micromonospora parathelypteridis]MBB5476377.1 putative membrane protein [Micromonospora parathelypteridis]GGO14857.1 membrane protein [Micromonospora parathelypteridis]
MSDRPAEPSTVPPAGPTPHEPVPPVGAPPHEPVPPGAAVPWPAPPGGGEAEPRQRLHPLSPLLHGAKSLFVVIAGLSWSTLSRVGFGWFAAMVVVLALGATVLSVISWYNTGYHVVGRELRVYEGLLWRRTRAIPLERLQAVEVVRPLLAQLTGLAELRLEVVGGGKTEAPLAYLGVADAARLRERLLALAGRVTQPTVPGHAVPAVVPVPGAAAPPATVPGRPLHAVRNQNLLVSQLLTPQAFLLPFGVAFVVVQFLTAGSWSFVAVASTLTAMAGVLLQPVRRVLDDWNFRLARDDGTLRVHNGLLETRAQTVPLARVQTVRATWPLLWRVNGWLRLRLEVAGYSVAEADDRNRPDRLLPVGDLPTATMIVAEVLPGVRLDALALTPPPRRTRWLHPLGRAAFGAGLFDEVFVTRSGRLTQQLVIVPYARIQSVRVVQGPLQRRLGLASVHADTAGGSGATAQDRDLAEAWTLAADLTARAQTARHPT